MVDNVFLERIARLVHEVHVHVHVVGVDLAAALVDGEEHRLDARRSLRHDGRGAGRSDGEAGDVAATYAHHLVVQFGIGLAQTADEGVVLLALGIVHLERATLLGHVDRSSVVSQHQFAVHPDREFDGLVRAITQAHRGQHVALAGGAGARAAPHQGLGAYLAPQVQLGTLHLGGLRIGLYLGDDGVYLLHLQVDDVVQHALGLSHMLAEKVEIELGLRREGVLYVAVQVYGHQSAAVVGTEGNLAAGVGGDGLETEVGVAVGH